MIINRIYVYQKSSVTVACFLPGRAKDLSAPVYIQNNKLLRKIFFNDSTTPVVLVLLIAEVSSSHSVIHTTLGRTTLD